MILGQEQCRRCVCERKNIGQGKLNWRGEPFDAYALKVGEIGREKMVREKGLEKWHDKRGRGGGLKPGKIDSARGKCERINLETFCRDTVLSLYGLSHSGPPLTSPQLVLHPPTPTCAQSSPSTLLHTPPLTKCHTWTIGIHYAQPGTRLLVDWKTSMFLGTC